jgi:hypothetical protein
MTLNDSIAFWERGRLDRCFRRLAENPLVPAHSDDWPARRRPSATETVALPILVEPFWTKIAL